MDKKGKYPGQRLRHWVQALWALLSNSYLAGFVHGKIYRGKLKNLCLPGMNCYSCPGALGSCPIGAMQAVIGSWNFKFAFYVAGFLMLWERWWADLPAAGCAPSGFCRSCCIKSPSRRSSAPSGGIGC